MATNNQPRQYTPTQAATPGPIQQTTQTQQTAQTTQEATGGVYRVGENGQAPQGLKAGDQVVTAGGTYTVNSVNPDGTYRTQLTNQGQTTKTYDAPANFPEYNHDTDYANLINQAVAAGDSAAAAYYESQRNKKIAAEGLPYKQTNNYGRWLSDVTPMMAAQYEKGYTPRNIPDPQRRMESLLDQWRYVAGQQAANQIDYAVESGVNELNRAMEDAQPKFQEQQNQNDIDTARAKDNSAMYAEARGDRGGIGQAQYNEIQAAALKNRQAINSARTKLATDTARQIQDLRLKGEFDRADKLLALSQSYLSQLISLEQWGAQWDMDQEQMARELEQWEKNYELQRANVTGRMNDGTLTRAAANDERDRAADVAMALLKVGVMPTQAQLDALGMTAAEAQSYIWAQSLGGYGSGGSSGGGGRKGGSSGGGGSTGSSGSSGGGASFNSGNNGTNIGSVLAGGILNGIGIIKP